MTSKHALILLVFVFFIGNSYGQYNNPFPVIKLTTKPRKLNFSDYVNCTATFLLNNDSLTAKNLSGQIKFRGNSAAHYKKKSFSLKLSEKIKITEGIPSKNWKLNAEYIDKTFIRNKLSYELFNLFSEDNFSPKIIYANLFINNRYNGLYTITERVDANRLGLNKKDTTAVLFKEPPISQDPDYHKENYENFVKYYHWAKRYKEYSSKELTKTTQTAYFNQRYPDINTLDKTSVIYELTDFIYYSPDSVFKNEKIFNQFFDLKNIIDWQILLLVTNNADGVVKNFYLYKKDKNSPYLFSPWDYDHGYGRDGDGEKHIHNLIDFKRMELIHRLMDLNAFDYNSKLLSRFIELKENGILTPNFLKSRIIDLAWQLNGQARINEKKWPLRKIDLFRKTNFVNEINLILEWVPLQLQRVENHLISIAQAN